MERRLAAIMLTDIVGYSRLMGLDEEGTVARQRAHRQDIFDPNISQHGGRIVKSTGDGLLVEFPSVVDAMRCAVHLQTELAENDPKVPEDRQLRYRIGINLGDIVIDGDDILGDGVNVAARLEGLSQPGGICISGSVHEQIAYKTNFAFADAGEQTVKNVPRPVRVWHWLKDETALGEQIAGEPPPLPTKPSIAVLPFANMSGDPEQSYFADGITEDIISGLSRCRSVSVISRSSCFAFKNVAGDVREISVKLGARYIVEGSVRRAGAKVRVTVQLIDAISAGHVWSERFERDLDDIFAVQDEITLAVLGTLLPEIGAAEAERARREPPDNLDAWALYYRGVDHMYRYTYADNSEARALFRRAIESDEKFAPAYAGLSYASFLAVHDDYTDELDECIREGIDSGRKAVRLDSKDAVAHTALARNLTIARKYDEAIEECNAAIELNPSFGSAYFGRAYSLTMIGRALEALSDFEKAIAFSPSHPNLWAFMCVNAWAHIQCGDCEQAHILAQQLSRYPNTNFWAPATLSATLAHLGRMEDARTALSEAMIQKPDLSLAYIGKTLPFLDPGIRDTVFGILTDLGMRGDSSAPA